jgi:hypothetical protein
MIKKKPAAGMRVLRVNVVYLLTGDAGSSNKAMTCLICASVKMPLWPKRGMLEQAL